MTDSPREEHRCPNCGAVVLRPSKGSVIRCKCGGMLVLPDDTDDDLPGIEGESRPAPLSSNVQSDRDRRLIPAGPVRAAKDEPLDEVNVVEYRTAVDAPGWSRGFVFVFALLLYPGLLGVAEFFKGGWDQQSHPLLLGGITLLCLPFCAFVSRTARCRLHLKRYRLDQPRCTRVQSVMGIPLKWRPIDLGGDSGIVLLIRRKGLGPIGCLLAIANCAVSLLVLLFYVALAIFALSIVILLWPLFLLAFVMLILRTSFGGGDSYAEAALDNVAEETGRAERLRYRLTLRDRKGRSVPVFRGRNGGEVQAIVRKLRAATDLILEFDAKTNASSNSLATYLKSQYSRDADSQTYRAGQLTDAQSRILAPLAAPLLVVLLAKNKPAERANAARALGRIGRYSNVVVPCLARAVVEDVAWEVRYQGVKALRMFGPEARSAIAELAIATGDAHRSVAVEACEALGCMEGAAYAALPALGRAATRKSWRVRRAALHAMKRIDPVTAREYFGFFDWCGWLVRSMVNLLFWGGRVAFAATFVGACLFGYCWAIPRSEQIGIDYADAVENASNSAVVLLSRGEEQLQRFWQGPQESPPPPLQEEIISNTPADEQAIDASSVEYVSLDPRFSCEYPANWTIDREATCAGHLQLYRDSNLIILKVSQTGEAEFNEADRDTLEQNVQDMVRGQFTDDHVSQVKVRLTKNRNRSTLSASYPLSREGGGQARIVRFIDSGVDCIFRLETNDAELGDSMKAFGHLFRTLSFDN